MGRKAKPGETILVKVPPWKNKEFVVTECPQRAVNSPIKHYTWAENPGGGEMSFSDPGDYVIVTTKTEWAVPGDTIQVTYHGLSGAGRQHLVIECPPNATTSPSGCAWHENPNSSPTFCRIEYYKIVKRKNEGVSTPSIVNDTPVDLDKSFRQKRDALLRGYFT